ncbi:cell division protein FtsW, lipid II flippase [Natronincola peptidivorans]|uniref:Cell division protein FtsW, lipid II flippase n=1 Tax=Natronincola peptidivorans TaxID=426128 RepID=A0A1H9ZLV8_9FIRM|nr:FtsW/RodA/SpoVE family cell cycle protein [Natronincola peptidivorans]SES82532.1 cell division protein FtsW, lipid II flippase [Natronincola peptidivorans]
MRPIGIMVIINALLFGLLFLLVEPLDPSILMAGGILTLLIIISYIIIVKGNMGDQYLFLIISMLSSLGVVMIYRLDPVFGFRQITWYALGVSLYFVSYIIFLWVKNWDRYLYLYIGFGMLLFLLTFALGTTVKGATNWIRVGGFTFQPAEIIKLSFVFFVAAYFTFPEKLKNIYFFLGVVYLHIIFLVFQRDMGMAMLFYGIFISIFYVYYQDYKLFLYNLGASILIVVFGYYTMTHVQVRFEAWLNPWRDIAGRGYQITQSLFAIGTGGFFGTGLGMGSPDFIPEVHTDFIFSAICEEMGVFGGMAVVLLYFILMYRGFKITLTIQNTFRKILALGIILTYSYQTFMIIGGVIKLIPLTGITLPFISYGGSALVSAFIAFGIMQALSKRSQEVEELLDLGEQ